MTDTFIDSDRVVAQERPELLVFCALVALVGNLAPFGANAWAVAVAEHDFVADTISDLARGPHKWIMDTGFYLNAAGLLALAIASAHVHLGRWAWSLGIFTLAFLALAVTFLGLWDDIHTAPSDPEALSVHTRITFALGPLYLAGPLLMARGAASNKAYFAWLFVAASVLWAVFATGFKLAPNDYDGLLEKIAVTATLLWTLPLALLFLGRGRRAMA